MHISSAVNFGGGERHVVDLCRGLAAQGNDVFVALRPTNKWESRLDFLPATNLMHVSIRNSFGVFSARRIAEFARQNEIDIIHAHVARDYIPASIASIASKRSKFVLTRHVMFPLKPFNRFALRNLSKAIAVSPAVADDLKRLFGAARVALIRNGMQTADMSDDEMLSMSREFRAFHEIPAGALLVGTVGELIPLKGQRDLVLAAAEVLKAIPDAYFVIVGVDNSLDQRHRRELRRLARVMGLEHKFLWLDWVEDLRPLLAALDVYVSPSHTESFGLATLEAMAAGKAIVATDTEGSRELLEGRGPLVPVDDPVALAGAITELLRDEERRERLGADLRMRAASVYSFEEMLHSTEKLYREVLGR